MKSEVINSILTRGVTKKYYRGTYPEDIQFNFATPYCVVTNCDTHNGPGTHWNAWYFEKSMTYFFDSYGRSADDETLPKDYQRLIKTKNYLFNHRIVEGIFSKTCGEFCIYVLHFFCQGYTWDEIIESFSEDTNINDEYVKEFVKKLKK